MGEKIEITMINLPKQRVTEVKECYVELHEIVMRLRYWFYADEPKSEEDDALGWEVVMNDFDVYIKKTAITAVELSLTHNPTRYRVMFSAQGVMQDWKVYFRKKSEADQFLTKINKWLFNL